MQNCFKILATAFLLLSSLGCHAQALRDINYNYLYNPLERISFEMAPVRSATRWTINYSLQVRDTAMDRTEDFDIEWQGREALSNKEGDALSPETTQFVKRADRLIGAITLPAVDAPRILTARLVNRSNHRAYFFYTSLESNFPVNNWLISSGEPLIAAYAPTGQSVTLAQSGSWIVSYYNDNFPAAAPAFSEGQAKVSKGMVADSVYSVSDTSLFTLFAKGLYLLQKDTLAAEGFAIRAENDYPRYSLVQNLPGPLIYICTKQEYDRLEQAKGDKKAFDRTVLSMTGDTERAKKLIRNYFRRVELANQYFTSFKEGWKTDRGMIYIIFGLPDEVYKFSDREVWHYDNEAFDITFDFIKASTIFDPDNYVLLRERKYQATWYEVIDLWRNARF
jgi:GWxTD domain-containing protein